MIAVSALQYRVVEVIMQHGRVPPSAVIGEAMGITASNASSAIAGLRAHFHATNATLHAAIAPHWPDGITVSVQHTNSEALREWRKKPGAGAAYEYVLRCKRAGLSLSAIFAHIGMARSAKSSTIEAEQAVFRQMRSLGSNMPPAPKPIASGARGKKKRQCLMRCGKTVSSEYPAYCKACKQAVQRMDSAYAI